MPDVINLQKIFPIYLLLYQTLLKTVLLNFPKRISNSFHSNLHFLCKKTYLSFPFIPLINSPPMSFTLFEMIGYELTSYLRKNNEVLISFSLFSALTWWQFDPIDLANKITEEEEGENYFMTSHKLPLCPTIRQFFNQYLLQLNTKNCYSFSEKVNGVNLNFDSIFGQFFWALKLLPPTRKKVAFLFENSYVAKYSINFDETNWINLNYTIVIT